MRPAGSGRLAVRRILASTSTSYHWLSAPQAPAARAMHRIAVKPRTSGNCAGATNIPHRPEKTTRLITRGLVRATKSRQSAGSAAGLLSSRVGLVRAYKGVGTGGKAWPAGMLARFIGALLCARAMKHRILAAALLAALAAPAFAQGA